jgi:subtilisin family serine protease
MMNINFSRRHSSWQQQFFDTWIERCGKANAHNTQVIDSWLSVARFHKEVMPIEETVRKESKWHQSYNLWASNRIDVVSISFGGYLDRSDPDQEANYQAYINAVVYAQRKGTVIVAAAGNEHLRIGAGGQVISRGPLTAPGDPFQDYYGLWETPGGVTGVVMVSATGNVVNAASDSCEAGTFETSYATCKPRSDAHQPFGVGRQNQLTYYSNYGPRIDIAAPGGARKFNLPLSDRGGTPGWPATVADGYTAWEDFSITSNWALEIPCYYGLGAEFYPDECYSTIQGTSMATPHVSAVLALIASSKKWTRHNPGLMVQSEAMFQAWLHDQVRGWI